MSRLISREFWILSASLVSGSFLAGCSGTSTPLFPLPEVEVLFQGARATADVEAEGGQLLATVTFENPSSDSITVEFLGGNCMLHLKLYRDRDGQGRVVYNGAQSPCQLEGADVNLAPGEVRSIADTISRSLVRREAGGGEPFESAVVITELDWDRVEIGAGEVRP